MAGKKVVIIIDDSLVTRKILEVCLRRADIASLSFADGLEALAALRAQPDLDPTVILLDMRLPHQDGLHVAWRLRRMLALPRTAIIVLSGYNTLPTRVKAWLIADHYIAKPFKTAAIVAAVSRRFFD